MANEKLRPYVVGAIVAAASVKAIELILTVPPPVGVDVPEILSRDPEVREVSERLTTSPVVLVEEMVNLLLVVSQPKPEASEVIDVGPLKKAIWPEVPEPVMGTPEAQVMTLLPESRQSADDALPAERPLRIKVESESRVKVMSLVEAGVAVRVVNAPVPAVVAPMETKLAAPAPEIFQLSSSRAKEEEAVVVPMVIELATAPVPILIVSAVVPPVPMDMVSAPVPVPILMALVRLPPAPRFKVVAAPAKLRVVVLVLRRSTDAWSETIVAPPLSCRVEAVRLMLPSVLLSIVSAF